jgi:catechol 2,3-dioxygenase-like lactoylglutathione lyase family enzyme
MGNWRVEGLDHLAITVADVEVTIDWYRRVLGAELLFEDEWKARAMPVALLQIGASRLSIHDAASPAAPHAAVVTPGSADVCVRVDGAIEAIRASLSDVGVVVVEGPVARPASNGAAGMSLYVRDPDGNLVELLTTTP